MNKAFALTLLLGAAWLPGASAQTAPAPAAPLQTPPAQAAPPQGSPAQATPTQTVPIQAAPAAAPAPRIPAGNYVVIGNIYYNQGKFDQAYVAFRAATESEPNNASALLGLGRSQTRLRLYGPSIETLSRLTKVEPTNISGYVALAQAYQQGYIGSGDRAAVAGNLEAAARALLDAEGALAAQSASLSSAALGLERSKLLNERGNLLRLQGRLSDAAEAYRSASALSPENSLILYNLGETYSALGNQTQALAALQQAVILDPADAYNRAYYAKLLALSGNASAARAEAAQAARLAPGNAYAVGQYGVVSYLAGDRAAARTQLNQALKLEPLRYPEFYYYLGRLDLDASDLKAARDSLTRAAALGSNNPEYAYYLGLAYERSAGTLTPDKLKARENYERALKLAPGYQQAKEGLERVK